MDNQYNSTQHGEKVYTNNGFEFSAWSGFAWQCSYYFSPLLESITELNKDFNDDQIIKILVFAICRSLNLETKIEPEGYKDFLFC